MALFSKQKETAFEKFAKEFGFIREKNAEETILSDNTDAWQSEVANAGFTNTPYLSNYAVNVSLDKMDGDHGNAFGNLTIKNKIEDNLLNNGKAVQVPIIIQDRHLKPFDLMNVDGKVLPLTEEKLRETLFSPNIAELSNRKPLPDRYIGGQTSPPFMGHGGSSGMSYSYDGMGKFAEKKSTLDAIDISKEQKEDLLKKLASEDMKIAFEANRSFAKCIEKIANKRTTDTLDNAVAISFKKLGQRDVGIKWISPGFEFNVAGVRLSKAAEMMGNDDLYNTPPGESIILSTNTAQKDTLEDSSIAEIKSFGQYKVQDIEGRELMGYVIPIISFDNKPLPSLLFSNGSHWTLQAKIAGELVGVGTKLPNNTPSGLGVFYLESDGRVVCTEPVEVSHSEGSSFICKDALMQPVSIELTDTLSPMKMGEGQYIFPTNTKFMMLPEDMITLREDPLTVEKLARLRKYAGTDVRVTRFGNDYRIETPLLKTAQLWDKEDADLILHALGFREDLSLIKHATSKTLYGGLEIPQKKEIYIKEAEDLRKELSKIDILKIASSLKEEDTIDKILSMGFLNSDNVQRYIDMLPEFEQTENNLADLLFASRCGLTNIPEESTKLALTNMSKLIKGLKDVKEKNNLSIPE